MSARITIDNDGWLTITGGSHGANLEFQVQPDGGLWVAANGEYGWELTAAEARQVIENLAHTS